MREPEKKIIDLLKVGDNSAYKYLYDHYYSFLCTIAYDFLRDDFIAETIVDDLIFHLWEKRENLRITTSLKAYLVRAVRNRCINHLQLEREQREQSFSAIAITENSPVFHLESVEYPLATLLEKELEQEINQAIANLPADCQCVFHLSRREEKRYDQIAEELGISVNTVKYHMKNALARLSRDLSHYLVLLLPCVFPHTI